MKEITVYDVVKLKVKLPDVCPTDDIVAIENWLAEEDCSLDDCIIETDVVITTLDDLEKQLEKSTSLEGKPDFEEPGLKERQEYTSVPEKGIHDVEHPALIHSNTGMSNDV